MTGAIDLYPRVSLSSLKMWKIPTIKISKISTSASCACPLARDCPRMFKKISSGESTQSQIHWRGKVQCQSRKHREVYANLDVFLIGIELSTNWSQRWISNHHKTEDGRYSHFCNKSIIILIPLDAQRFTNNSVCNNLAKNFPNPPLNEK